jgi:hypothetical protein
LLFGHLSFSSINSTQMRAIQIIRHHSLTLVMIKLLIIYCLSSCSSWGYSYVITSFSQLLFCHGLSFIFIFQPILVFALFILITFQVSHFSFSFSQAFSMSTFVHYYLIVLVIAY